jgi:hypothetical protein
MWKTLLLAAAVAGNTLAAGAQETRERRPAPPPPPADLQVNEFFISGPEGPHGVEPGGDTFVFVSSEMSFGGKVVKGAPYSAQAVTESVQTLSDGNRIVRKNSAHVYRDSEGRTRRDQTLAHFGPYATAGDAAQTSFINDPVSGVNLILDPRTKTARKLPPFEFHFRPDNKEGGEREKTVQREFRVERSEAAGRGFVFETRMPPPPGGGPDVQFLGRSSKAETKTEKLEKRTVEGVEAEGHRTVTTIPAGEFGNELPIQIVHERWYSPELQVVVMTRHSDPRFGETTYRLTNISRGEPSASLFQAPSDYTLKESPARGRGPLRTRRHIMPPQEN